MLVHQSVCRVLQNPASVPTSSAASQCVPTRRHLCVLYVYLNKSTIRHGTAFVGTYVLSHNNTPPLLIGAQYRYRWCISIYQHIQAICSRQITNRHEQLVVVSFANHDIASVVWIAIYKQTEFCSRALSVSATLSI